MKALSLLQPWATLVVMGLKKIETRSWSTTYRGPLLIHASMGRRGGLIVQEPPFVKDIPRFDALPFGALVGQVILADIVPVDTLPMTPGEVNRLSLEERAFGDYTRGRFAWLLEDPYPFPRPLPVRGTLGLWDYSGPLEA